MHFVDDNASLNHIMFNEDTCYHVISKYDPPRGYLKRLAYEIHGSCFHGI